MGEPGLVGRYGLSAAVLGAVLWLASPAIAAQKPSPPPADAAAGGAAAAAPAAPAGAPAAGADQSAAPAWAKICESDPKSKKELCVVTQELHNDSGQAVASATIRRVTGDDKVSLIATVPVGLFLPAGMRVQIDNGKQYPIAYQICLANGCYGELDINDDFITALQGGKQLVVIAVDLQKKGHAFPMTLAGFKKVYESKGLDANAAQQRQDDLNKALQARAAETRKKLIEQQQKEGGGAPAQ